MPPDAGSGGEGRRSILIPILIACAIVAAIGFMVVAAEFRLAPWEMLEFCCYCGICLGPFSYFPLTLALVVGKMRYAASHGTHRIVDFCLEDRFDFRIKGSTVGRIADFIRMTVIGFLILGLLPVIPCDVEAHTWDAFSPLDNYSVERHEAHSLVTCLAFGTSWETHDASILDLGVMTEGGRYYDHSVNFEVVVVLTGLYLILALAFAVAVMYMSVPRLWAGIALLVLSGVWYATNAIFTLNFDEGFFLTVVICMPIATLLAVNTIFDWAVD